MKLYFGNLSPQINDQQLNDLAAQFGKPSSAVVVKDKQSGVSRGFGFVEFPNDNEARAAIAGLNGKEVNGQKLTVNEARARK